MEAMEVNTGKSRMRSKEGWAEDSILKGNSQQETARRNYQGGTRKIRKMWHHQSKGTPFQCVICF